MTKTIWITKNEGSSNHEAWDKKPQYLSSDAFYFYEMPGNRHECQYLPTKAYYWFQKACWRVDVPNSKVKEILGVEPMEGGEDSILEGRLEFITTKKKK